MGSVSDVHGLAMREKFNMTLVPFTRLGTLQRARLGVQMVMSLVLGRYNSGSLGII